MEEWGVDVVGDLSQTACLSSGDGDAASGPTPDLTLDSMPFGALRSLRIQAVFHGHVTNTPLPLDRSFIH